MVRNGGVRRFIKCVIFDLYSIMTMCLIFYCQDVPTRAPGWVYGGGSARASFGYGMSWGVSGDGMM